MTNILGLYELRVGKEISTDAWGTAVAQSHKMMGVTDFQLNPMVESAQVEDHLGSLAPAYRSVYNRKHATASMSGQLDYQYSPILFDMLFGTASPTADTEYTYAYTAPLGTAPTPKVLTMAWGNDADADSIKSLVGGTLQTFQLSGSAGGPLTYQVGLIGKSVDTDTFDSAAEANSTVTVVRGCDVALAIDPSSDAAGTTAISNTWFDFDLNVNTNRSPFWYLGNCAAGNFRPAKWNGTLRLGLEVNATSMAWVDAILQTTADVYERVVRITATNGTNITRITFNGVALEAPALVVDKDGVASIDWTLTGQYHSTLGNWLTASVVNSVASMPA